LLTLFFDPEDGGDVFFRNVCSLSTDYKALYHRRQDSSIVSLQSAVLIVMKNAYFEEYLKAWVCVFFEGGWGGV
jgi:hypothetical protein